MCWRGRRINGTECVSDCLRVHAGRPVYDFQLFLYDVVAFDGVLILYDPVVGVAVGVGVVVCVVNRECFCDG